MVAVEWSDLSHAGALLLGMLIGTITTIRLAKILAEFLRRERDRP